MNARITSKHPLIFLASLFFLLCSQVPLAAREKPLKFDHVVDLGVDTMQAFYQDSDGFLWIGTSTNGLFRYDGYTLQNYGIEHGELAHGNITRIIGDSLDPDILWISTLGGGFFRFNRTTVTFTNYTYHPDHEGLASPVVYSILEDSQNPNVLWLVGDKLLQSFEKETHTFSQNFMELEQAAMLQDTQMFNILQDQVNPDVFWISSWGLIKFDHSSRSFSSYIHDPQEPASLGFETNYIGSMAHDKDDPSVLWLGYWDGPGLDRFDTSTGTFTHYAHDPDDPHSLRNGSVQLIYDDGEGRLWLGGWGDANGLTVFDKQAGEFTTYTHTPGDRHSISSNTIVNVSKDRTGILWIVNTNGKIDKYDRYNQNFRLYQHHPGIPNSLVNNAMVSMYEDPDGLLWFSTEGGLSRFDPKNEVFTNYTYNRHDSSSLQGNHVLCTYQDSAGNFWVGLYARDLQRFDKQTGQVLERIQLPEGSGVAAIVEDPQTPDILWFGVLYKGFARYNTATRRITYYPPNYQELELGVTSVEITEVLHDRRDPVIWLGARSGNGLSRFHKPTNRFTHYQADLDDPHALSHDNIGALYQDDSGAIWIGTLGGGLNRFSPETERFTRYGNQHGVPPIVNGILEDDDGELWLSTNQGIVRFNPLTESVDARYVKQDGLQGDAFLPGCRLKTRDGTMWFGGTNGVNSFHPDELTTNPYPPPVLLTALTQGGEPQDWDERGTIPDRLEHIELSWRDNFFEFEYAALNYTIPEKNQYKYMLEGLDKDWYHAGPRRTGRYAGIPAGKYTLRIIGANNDGLWNKEGVSLGVTVIPPFWKTSWFLALCIISTFGLFFGFFYIRTRQLQHFNIRLQESLDERTEELNQANAEIVKLEKEQLERQMAGGFAHEMRNALVGVIIGLDVVIEGEETTCHKNSELLGDMFDLIESSLPEEKMEDVIHLLKTIDNNEETLDTILKETKQCTSQALEVTKMILEYSRLGRTEAGNDQVQIQQILERIYKDHAAHFASEYGITLTMQGASTGTMLAHVPHIHSIFNNIVLNARDALLDVKDERNRSIAMTLGEEDERVIVTISDNADGIPEKDLEQIFEPFFSTKPTTGTGLGLNFVAKLVKLYRGTIDVSSTEGKGTTFTLTFPVQK